mgnify:CR=1 FL=1
MMHAMQSNSIDLIFADPPYFLSNGGITCQNGKMASVNKGEWDKIANIEEMHCFNRIWLQQAIRILKDSGSIFISGTLHNIFSIGMAIKQEGCVILNNIIWQKLNPPPNISCKCFTHSTETILWAVKDKKKYYFNYALMKEYNGGKQMKDVWSGPLTPKKEKSFGRHPTQKPEYLLERIILAASKKADLILDPFCGSGTTGVIAMRYSRNFIGIDREFEYIELAKRRIDNERLQRLA